MIYAFNFEFYASYLSRCCDLDYVLDLVNNQFRLQLLSALSFCYYRNIAAL